MNWPGSSTTLFWIPWAHNLWSKTSHFPSNRSRLSKGFCRSEAEISPFRILRQWACPWKPVIFVRQQNAILPRSPYVCDDNVGVRHSEETNWKNFTYAEQIVHLRLTETADNHLISWSVHNSLNRLFQWIKNVCFTCVTALYLHKLRCVSPCVCNRPFRSFNY